MTQPTAPSPIPCILCGSPTQAGYVPDNARNSFHQSYWAAGDPVPSFWYGIKRPLGPCFALHAYRCATCGYVMFFATEQVTQ